MAGKLLRVRVTDNHEAGWQGTQLYPPGTTLGTLVVKETAGRHVYGRKDPESGWLTRGGREHAGRAEKVPYLLAVIVRRNRRPAALTEELEDGDQVTLTPRLVTLEE